jgi:hypothetical protein
VRASSWVRRAAIALALVGLVAAVGASSAGIVLALDYHPRSAGAHLAVLPPAVQRSSSWGDWHRRSGVAFLASTTGASAVVAWLMFRAERPVPRRAAVATSSIIAVAAAVVTSLTRHLVEFDYVGLQSVTVGSDMSGYWFAAFDENVRFIVVHNRRVSQGEYIPALIAHLAAPMLGVAALAIIAWTLLSSTSRYGRSPEGRRSTTTRSRSERAEDARCGTGGSALGSKHNDV